MTSLNLDLVREIHTLWEPVYPHLIKQIHELYGRNDGLVLEIGPFCGLIFAMQREKIGSSLLIATFPPGVDDYFRQETKRRRLEDKIQIIETDPSLNGIEENSIDLAIFRGAFFFPSLFKVDLSAIHRVLRTNGVAFIGGGFGKYTPEIILQSIGKKSRDLNLQLGKIEIREDDLRQLIRAKKLEGKAKIISEGGLWVVMRK